MYLQRMLSFKTFLTLTAWIPVQLSCSMYLFVLVQASFLCKPFFTHCTQIRSCLVIMLMLSDIITISFCPTFTCKYKILTVTIASLHQQCTKVQHNMHSMLLLEETTEHLIYRCCEMKRVYKHGLKLQYKNLYIAKKAHKSMCCTTVHKTVYTENSIT